MSVLELFGVKNITYVIYFREKPRTKNDRGYFSEDCVKRFKSAVISSTASLMIGDCGV